MAYFFTGIQHIFYPDLHIRLPDINFFSAEAHALPYVLAMDPVLSIDFVKATLFSSKKLIHQEN